MGVFCVLQVWDIQNTCCFMDAVLVWCGWFFPDRCIYIYMHPVNRLLCSWNIADINDDGSDNVLVRTHQTNIVHIYVTWVCPEFYNWPAQSFFLRAPRHFVLLQRSIWCISCPPNPSLARHRLFCKDCIFWTSLTDFCMIDSSDLYIPAWRIL